MFFPILCLIWTEKHGREKFNLKRFKSYNFLREQYYSIFYSLSSNLQLVRATDDAHNPNY